MARPIRKSIDPKGKLSIDNRRYQERVVTRMLVVKVKRSLQFTQAIVDCLCGDALLSLEGDLSRALHLLDRIPGITHRETELMRRNTAFVMEGHGKRSVLGFAILPIEAMTKDIIVRQILPLIGIRKHIKHIHIVRNEKLEFVSYDQFDFAAVSQQVSESFLGSLLEQHIISGYEASES